MQGYPRLSFLIPLFLVLVTACSDDSPSGTGGTADTTPPTVESVTPVDVLHFKLTFDEPIAAAGWWFNYLLIESTVPSPASGINTVSPGDTVRVALATLEPDDRTVLVTTHSPMNGRTYTVEVRGIPDLHGNYIQPGASVVLFTASNLPDTTPPEIATRSPVDDETNVSINPSVSIGFTEPVQDGAGTMTWTSQSGDVAFYRGYATIFGQVITLHATPHIPLAHDDLQTILISGFRDESGNVMPDVQWSFRTAFDARVPVVTSIFPRNGATNVNVRSDVVVAYSKPMQYSGITLSPDFSSTLEWSKDRRTCTLHPIDPLAENQQYTLIVQAGWASDQFGNAMAEPQTAVFSTGSKLASGSIAGTITGDPGTAAADPSGAVVFVEFAYGVAMVAGNNSYSIPHLADQSYRSVYAHKDTNGDHVFSTTHGDAWGEYGVDSYNFFDGGDSVTIVNGGHLTGISFPIFDPSAIWGRLSYDAQVPESAQAYVGLFKADEYQPGDFSPLVIRPTYGTLSWSFNAFYNEIDDGDYYVGGFIDLNGDSSYEPAQEPAGMYGGFASPTLLHVANGADFLNIVITLDAPAPSAVATTSRVRWQVSKPNLRLQRLMERIDRVADRALEKRTVGGQEP